MEEQCTNALVVLAEEAEELKRVLEDMKFDRRVVVCDKLRRIVEELAKVGFWKSTGRPHFDEAVSAVSNCREIAEEGVK